MKKTSEKKKAEKKFNQLNSAAKQKKLKKELYENKEWYTIRSLLGNQ